MSRPAASYERFALGFSALACALDVVANVFLLAVRLGPRLLLYLAVFLGLSILVTQLVSRRDPRGGAWWPWPWSRADVPSPALSTGKLRIVVFGEQDVGTPDRGLLASRGEGTPSWTEILCEELNCSTHMHFIPSGDGPKGSMISPEMYSRAVQQLLKDTDPSRGPGENYTFQPSYFPIPWELPGLGKQVTAFLATEDPMGAALETLWVFTFGMWDVWSLATFPLNISQPFVTLMTRIIFEQADRLYASALKETLVADARRWPGPRVDARSGSKTSDQHVAMFRIFVPELLDPSLLPAWRTSRPRLNPVHSKAEQMRNACLLSKQWNREVHEQMDRWVLGHGSDGGATGWLRDGFVFELPQYVVTAIMERQMRDMGVQGVGRDGQAYWNVSTPCAAAGDDELVVAACENREDYLFSTPFVAGRKAVRGIGVLAAEVVKSNKSQRTLGRYIPPPQPGAWFEEWLGI